VIPKEIALRSARCLHRLIGWSPPGPCQRPASNGFTRQTPPGSGPPLASRCGYRAIVTVSEPCTSRDVGANVTVTVQAGLPIRRRRAVVSYGGSPRPWGRARLTEEAKARRWSQVDCRRWSTRRDRANRETRWRPVSAWASPGARSVRRVRRTARRRGSRSRTRSASPRRRRKRHADGQLWTGGSDAGRCLSGKSAGRAIAGR